MDNPTIEIKGKEYPYLSGRGAMRIYCRKKGITDVGGQDLIDVLMKMSPSDADLLNYYSLKTGCSKEGKEFPYTFEEFQEVLDDHPHLVDDMERIAEEQNPNPTQLQNNDLPGNTNPVKKNP